MNLIGKILVGVIFVMSIVLMTLSVVLYSTQHKWKDQFQKVNDEKQQVQTQNTKLQDESAKLKDEYARIRADLEADGVKLAAENTRLAEQNKTLEAEMGEYRTAADNAIKLSTTTQEHMLAQRDELLASRTQMAATETKLHTQFEEYVKANHTARELAMALASLQSTYNVLNKDLGEARFLLTQLGHGDLSPEVYDAKLLDIPPRVEGTITDLRPNGMVEINIGRDDGLLLGHKLHVYRDNEGYQSYLGRIEIINVKPGKAVGKIMPEYRNGTIMQNDNVTAYLHMSQIPVSQASL